MSSSHNTPCIKHKLVVSIYSNTETSLAMSGLAFSVAPPPLDYTLTGKYDASPAPRIQLILQLQGVNELRLEKKMSKYREVGLCV